MLDFGLGATCLGDNRCHFLVWAPHAARLDVHVLAPHEQIVALSRSALGYFEGTLERVPPGSTYLYQLDGHDERPDPASRHQPAGVHGPSAVVDPTAFIWTDHAWRGIPQ
jgi:maltooligosyltrehalose trehalohydrolase